MKIADILRPEDVILDLRSADKPRMLEELARRSVELAGVEASAISDALNARERLGSTGMGAGIAIPHARLPSLMRPVGLFARLRPPIDFDAIDGQRVDLVFLLLLPAQAQGDHLNALACVARKLREDQAKAEVRKAHLDDQIYAILTRQIAA
ncbi:MAG: PTS sugar transporter subunit IIA [Janthinobacterium lividum]